MQKLLPVLFLVLLFGSGSGAFAQSSSHGQIQKRFDRFAGFTKQLAVDSILAYTYPKLFQLVSPRIVRASLAQATTDEDMCIEMGLPRLDSISRSVFTYEAESFALVHYHAPMSITLLSKAYRDAAVYERIGRQLAEEYGIENLAGDRGRFQYTIDAPKRLFAIRRHPKGKWYFLEYSPENLVFLDALVPQPVRRHFGLQ